MARLLGLALAVCWVMLTAGCSAYVEDFRYQPRPALADVPAATAGQPSPASAMASIVGIRRADKKANIPLSVEVRLRVDNNGPTAITLDPHSMEMTNEMLLKFEPPMVEPPGPLTIEPGQSAMVLAHFPFPPGRNCDNTELASLQLRWKLGMEGRSVRQVVYFTRVWPQYYYDPYYYDSYPWYGPRVGVFFHGDYGHRR